MKNRPNKPSKTPTPPQAKTPSPRNAQPTDEQIRARAHEIYLKRGGTQGHALEDWIAAERELRGR